jgi:hypothetical protein
MTTTNQITELAASLKSDKARKLFKQQICEQLEWSRFKLHNKTKNITPISPAEKKVIILIFEMVERLEKQKVKP